MTSTQEKIIKPKLELLVLAKQLGSVSQACNVMGCYGKTPMQIFRDTTHITLEKNIPLPDLSDSEAHYSVAVR